MSLLNWVGTVGPVGKKEGETRRNSVETKNIIFPSYAPGA